MLCSVCFHQSLRVGFAFYIYLPTSSSPSSGLLSELELRRREAEEGLETAVGGGGKQPEEKKGEEDGLLKTHTRPKRGRGKKKRKKVVMWASLPCLAVGRRVGKKKRTLPILFKFSISIR